MKKFTPGGAAVILKKALFLILSLAVLVPSLALACYAAESENRVILVGGFPYNELMSRDAYGNYSGYGYDYLQEIAKWTGWKYEFVDCSWEKALALLEEGKIDLMGAVMKSPEREEAFKFSQLPMISSYGVLATSLSNEELPYEDFEAFDGITVGSLKDNLQAENFIEYGRENGFTPRMLYYDTQEELDGAVKGREIDACILTSVLRSAELRVVAKFGENDSYFAVKKGDSRLLEELNDAMRRIRLEDPYFNSGLNKRYFDLQAATPVSFSREELDYIKSSESIACVFNPNARPLSVCENGTPSGIAVDVCNRIKEKTGLPLEVLPVSSLEEATAAFNSGEAPLFIDKTHDFSWAKENGAMLTEPYLTAQTAQVSSGEVPYHPVVALYEEAYQNDMVKTVVGRASKVRYYETIEQCLEALRKGEADTTFVNSTIMTYEQSNPRYLNLQVKQLYGYTADICMAVKDGADPMLVSILNKALNNISITEINGIVSENMKSDQFNSIFNVVYARPLETLLIVGGVLLVIAVILLVLFRNRSVNAKNMEKLLYTDELTGGHNYNAFVRKATSYILESEGRYALLYMDMQRFKTINDTYGYDAGDRLLKSIARVLEGFVGEKELFARVYADKFVVLFQYTSDTAALARLDGLSRALEKLSSGEFENVKFLFSGGVYRLKVGKAEIVTAFDRASYAKDTVKGQFSNTFVFYDFAMRNRILAEKSLESSMVPALENGEFIPFYQPKVNVITGEVVGAEALVRWIKEDGAMLPPGEFLPFYEKNGFIVRIDFCVFEQVCRHIKAWTDSGKTAVPVSINFSRRHMTDPGFPAKISEIAEREGVSPALIEIEITETMMLDSVQTAVNFASEIKKRGFSVSIDDYGTGYSSISFLQELPLDVLKLDKAFIESAMKTKKARDIMSLLVAAMKDNGVRVLCEGIETEAQKDFIVSLNCSLVQGYLYAKPMAQKDFEAYLDRSKIATRSYLDFVPITGMEEHLFSGSKDFLSRVMPGWIMACYLEEGFPLFYISRAFLRAMGYEDAEFQDVTGSLFINCVWEEDIPRFLSDIDSSRLDDGEYALRFRVRKKGGGCIWLKMTGKGILSDNGRRAMLCVCTDVSDIMVLRNEKEQILNTIPGGVAEMVLAAEGPVIVSASRKFYEIIGHTEQEMKSRENKLFSVVYPADLPGAIDSMKKACASDAASCECLFRVCHSDGSLHWISLRGTLIWDKGKRWITAVGNNVDREIADKQNTQIINAKFQLALTTTDHAVYEYDMKAKRIYEQTGLYAYCPQDMSLENIPESMIESGFVHPEDAGGFRSMFEEARRGAQVSTCEMRIGGMDGGRPYVWVRTVLTTIYDEDSRPVKAVGIVENIDRQKKAESAFAKGEQYRRAVGMNTILSYDVNLDLDLIDRIEGESSRRLERIAEALPKRNGYSQLLKIAVSSMLAESDRERFLKDMSRDSLLAYYAEGVTEHEFEYRRLMPDGKELWVSALVHMISDESTGNALCYVSYRDIQARKSSEEDLRDKAARDELTGLFNRTSAKSLIEEYLRMGRSGISAFMMIDVDRFKGINDRYGHKLGDEFLISTANKILESLRDSDIVARIGGDEFVVLVKNLRSMEMPEAIAKKITDNISGIGEGREGVPRTTASIGIAVAPFHGRDFDTLYTNADRAMYRAKKLIGDHIAVYEKE